MSQTVAESWGVLEGWLAENAPEILDALGPPAKLAEIKALEDAIGIDLPAEFKESLRIHNGADRHCGPMVGVPLMSAKEIVREWKRLKPGKKDRFAPFASPMSRPEGAIKEDATNRQWIPFAGPDLQNYLALDFDPGELGEVGQVISFGADQWKYEEPRYVYGKSYGEFLAFVAKLFATGKVEPHTEYEDEPVMYLRLTKPRADRHKGNLLSGASALFPKKPKRKRAR